jgi:hypothetical protein
VSVATPKPSVALPTALSGILGAALALIVQVVLGWPVKPPAAQQPPAPAVVLSVVPEPSSVDRLVEAAKGRPSLIDDFEAAGRKIANDARARLKP